MTSKLEISHRDEIDWKHWTNWRKALFEHQSKFSTVVWMRPSPNQTCFQQTIADQIKKSKKGLLLQKIFPLPYQRIPIAWTGNRKMNKLVSPVVATLVSGIALSRQWIWDTHLGWVVQSSKEYNVKYSINVKCSNFTRIQSVKKPKMKAPLLTRVVPLVSPNYLANTKTLPAIHTWSK